MHKQKDTPTVFIEHSVEVREFQAGVNTSRVLYCEKYL